MKGFRIAACLAALCLAAGCTQRSDQDGTAVFRFAWYVPLSVTAAALAALGAGAAFLRTGNRYAWIGVLLGGLALPTICPTLFLDRVEVRADGFYLQTGFWFAPTRHDVRFADYRFGRITETVRQGRRRSVSYDLVLRAQGRTATVPLGDMMRNGPLPLIIENARKVGVVIVGDLPPGTNV